RVSNVVAEIELAVVDPHRPPLPERDEREPLAIARHVLEAGLEQREQIDVRRRWSLEDRQGADVHVSGAVLEVEKGRVQRAELLEPGHGGEYRTSPAPIF